MENKLTVPIKTDKKQLNIEELATINKGISEKWCYLKVAQQ